MIGVRGATTGLRVGMYAHHHGSGHLHRCRSIAAELMATNGASVTVFSSRAGADVELPMDTMEAQETGTVELDAAELGTTAVSYRDATAHGTLHWAPLGVPGLSDRMARIAEWVAQTRPDVFYVDVSVEVAVLVRLLGVPVVHIAMPGTRSDAPHQLAYAQASALIAAWPAAVPTPDHLRAHADRLHPVGGISRFDATTLPHPTSPRVRELAQPGASTVVVLQGHGGTSWTEDYWRDVERACPGWHVEVLGGRHTVDNPVPVIAAADVVVSAAGQNSVADIGLTTTPAVLVPQERPFGEQAATARAVSELGAAVMAERLPEPAAWADLLARASRRRDSGAASIGDVWNVRGAAARAAAVIARCGEHRASDYGGSQ